MQEEVQGNGESSWCASALSGVLSPEPDSAFAAEVVEQSRRLLDGLADEELRGIVLRKMETPGNSWGLRLY